MLIVFERIEAGLELVRVIIRFGRLLRRELDWFFSFWRKRVVGSPIKPFIIAVAGKHASQESRLLEHVHVTISMEAMLLQGKCVVEEESRAIESQLTLVKLGMR